MTVAPPMTGLVLAGGASRRMGRDKARLTVGGEPLVLRVARRIGSVCDPVLLASGDGHRLDDLGHREVADVPDGAGPLAGIVAGLEIATTPLVAVVAADMPEADPQVLVLLARVWTGEHAVVPRHGGRDHPLHGLYSPAAADLLRGCLRDGVHGVRDALSRLEVAYVGVEAWAHLDPGSRFLTNLNAPADLDALSDL